METLNKSSTAGQRIFCPSSAVSKLGNTQSMDADTGKRQIRKTRYCLTYENQYFEIDVYPFWNDQAIAEIELSDENADIVFPKQIKIIKEVTDDESYKNASLATIR